MTAGLALGLGIGLVAVAVVVWPSPWADPRRVLWWERHGAVSGPQPPAPAQEVAVAAQLMALALRTGLPVDAALERVVAHCPAELERDLMPVITAYERGIEPALAWERAPAIWEPVGAAFVAASRAGLPPSPLLLTAARSVLRREGLAREAAIGRVTVRLVLPLGAVLLPAFMLTTVVPLVIFMTRDFLAP